VFRSLLSRSFRKFYPKKKPKEVYPKKPDWPLPDIYWQLTDGFVHFYLKGPSGTDRSRIELILKSFTTLECCNITESSCKKVVARTPRQDDFENARVRSELVSYLKDCGVECKETLYSGAAVYWDQISLNDFCTLELPCEETSDEYWSEE